MCSYLTLAGCHSTPLQGSALRSPWSSYGRKSLQPDELPCAELVRGYSVYWQMEACSKVGQQSEALGGTGHDGEAWGLCWASHGRAVHLDQSKARRGPSTLRAASWHESVRTCKYKASFWCARTMSGWAAGGKLGAGNSRAMATCWLLPSTPSTALQMNYPRDVNMYTWVTIR